MTDAFDAVLLLSMALMSVVMLGFALWTLIDRRRARRRLRAILRAGSGR